MLGGTLAGSGAHVSAIHMSARLLGGAGPGQGVAFCGDTMCKVKVAEYRANQGRYTGIKVRLIHFKGTQA